MLLVGADTGCWCQRPRCGGIARRWRYGRGALIGLVQRSKEAVCKTVGSAYVGSNPTPATTCENGPLAAETRPGGRWTRSRIMERSNSARARSDFILCRHVPLQNLTNKNSSRSCIPYTALRAKTFTVSIQRSGMGVDPFHRSGELTLRRQRSEELRVSVR